MYCSSCGKQIADGAAFCPYCGTPAQKGNDASGGLAQRSGSIAASQPRGATIVTRGEQGTSTAGVAPDTAVVGTADVSGGPNAKRKGRIALAVVAFVVLVVFGVSRIALRSAWLQELLAIVDVTGRGGTVEFVEPAAEEFLHIGYDDGVGITAYRGEARAIRIPAELNGKPVRYVVLNNYDITHIELPDSITTIYRTFVDCSSLTEVTIPDSVTVIDEEAFYGCSSLTEVTIPDSVTVIDDRAFCRCSSLTEITIPDSVTEIGRAAFARCGSLTEITIPDSVTKIGNLAFSGCSSLRNLTIPDSVTTIYPGTFAGCSDLTVTYQGKEYTYANDPGGWWES